MGAHSGACMKCCGREGDELLLMEEMPRGGACILAEPAGWCYVNSWEEIKASSLKEQGEERGMSLQGDCPWSLKFTTAGMLRRMKPEDRSKLGGVVTVRLRV